LLDIPCILTPLGIRDRWALLVDHQPFSHGIRKLLIIVPQYHFAANWDIIQVIERIGRTTTMTCEYDVSRIAWIGSPFMMTNRILCNIPDRECTAVLLLEVPPNFLDL